MNICDQSDIVFLALHGENGEDGKIQATFDLMELSTQGTDFSSSCIAMNKAVSKSSLLTMTYPLLLGIHIKRGESYTWNQYPCVVKSK